MKTTNYFFMLACTLLLIACKTEEKKEVQSVAEVAVEEVKEKTIYEKIGGAEGVSAIVDDILVEHLKNDKIKHYFEPLMENEVHLNSFKTHVKNFLGAGTGGSEEYTGRDMVGAHKGLNISEADFLTAIDDILLVLDNHKVDRVSRNELLATLYSMKEAVIGQ